MNANTKSKHKRSKLIPSIDDIKNVRKNLKTVRSSPFATMLFNLKLRQGFIIFICAMIAWTIFKTVRNYSVTGTTGIIGKVAMVAIGIYIIWKIYSTIPAERKKIEYYKKNPHLINYCPIDTKEEIKDILDCFDEDGQNKNLKKQKEKGVKEDGTIKKESRDSNTNGKTKS